MLERMRCMFLTGSFIGSAALAKRTSPRQAELDISDAIKSEIWRWLRRCFLDARHKVRIH